MRQKSDGAGTHPVATEDDTPTPDAQWAAALRGDDEPSATAAFTEVYTRYRRRIIAYGQRSCRLLSHEAADVAEDVFTRCWEHRRSLRLVHGVERYLFRAMANGARDHRRATHRRHSREHESCANQDLLLNDDSSSAADHIELTAHIAAMLTTLTPRQRLVATMRLIHHHSVRATATQVGISPNTVRADLRRALACLSSRLTRW